MEPPKFRIKKVGEEYPEEKDNVETPIEDVAADLESINAINAETNTEEPILPQKISCINCEEELEKDTVICIACGTNQASGKGLKTKSVKQKKKKFKQTVVKQKKPMGAWTLNFIIFLVLSVPTYWAFSYINESINNPHFVKVKCEEQLILHHTNPKHPGTYSCYNDFGKNYKLYKATTKRELMSPNFVKAYCTNHKHGVNNKGEIVKVSKPVGEKVNVPKIHKRSQADADNMAMGTMLLFWGLLINLTARFSFCFYAIKDGIFTFLWCMIIPFYSIFFWLRNREEVGPSFTCAILSTIIIFIGMFCVISAFI